MKTTPTTILDACCGGRMFYFEKTTRTYYMLTAAVKLSR